MSAEFRQRMKKTAQDATSVSLIPDVGGGGDGQPSHLATTGIVFTQTATQTGFWGTAATDTRKFEIIVRPVS